MDAHTVMDEWEPSPFDGGLDELARLGGNGFSGAVESGDDWLFVAGGEALVVVSGLGESPTLDDLDAFEGASGRRHEAPGPAAARLAAMLALDGEVRGQYFSDDTPIGTVEETLSEGGFTGYVELAENVLSGDYYVVYEDGEATYVAFVGSTEQLVTGEEAETKTKNEVGIYSVVAVDLPAVELPEPPEPTGAASGGGPGVFPDTDEDDGPFGDESTGEPATGTEAGVPADGPADEPAGDGSIAGPGDEERVADPNDEKRVEGADDRPAGTADEDPDPGAAAGEPATAATDPVAEDGDEPEPVDAAADVRTVPSLDPEHSGRAEDGTPDADDGPDAGGVVSTDEPAPASDADPSTRDNAGTASTGADARRGSSASSAALAELRNELERLGEAYERLDRRVAALESGSEADSTAAVRGDGPSLSPAEALSKTTLFVREGTRGGPTLEDAHDGRADRDALASNVELERHTRFDAEGATVNGEPFDAFLESTQAYKFVEWLITDLPFEIRATGTQDEMAHLYDAIPDVDRVFFDEGVTVEDDGQRREVTVELVVRDRNGEPLFVASLDDSREPTPGRAIEPLVTDASDFCAANPTVAAAFAVTASYFEPDAIELAREATTGSLLSRNRYRSFVNLTRKNGYHLCLVEAREASLHLTLPEL